MYIHLNFFFHFIKYKFYKSQFFTHPIRFNSNNFAYFADLFTWSESRYRAAVQLVVSWLNAPGPNKKNE